jgi:predicted sulfurtransferase
MATSVKEMLAAANAAVPRLEPTKVGEMMKAGEVLLLDVRDAPEIDATGKIKGAIHVSRGMLEFRADPESPAHDRAFQRGRTVVVY